MQAYFVYDSKKSGAVTVSHLRFGDDPIDAPYLIEEADFVACHQFQLLHRLDVLEHARHGATLLLSCPYGSDSWRRLPRTVQEQIVAIEHTNGRDAAKAWLVGLKSNAKIYNNNVAALKAVDRGEVAVSGLHSLGMNNDMAVRMIDGMVQSQSAMLALNQVMMFAMVMFAVCACMVWLAPKPMHTRDVAGLGH